LQAFDNATKTHGVYFVLVDMTNREGFNLPIEYADTITITVVDDEPTDEPTDDTYMFVMVSVLFALTGRVYFYRNKHVLQGDQVEEGQLYDYIFVMVSVVFTFMCRAYFYRNKLVLQGQVKEGQLDDYMFVMVSVVFALMGRVYFYRKKHVLQGGQAEEGQLEEGQSFVTVTDLIF
jgi:membrane protein implicated in regulation of membrane protease activity